LRGRVLLAAFSLCFSLSMPVQGVAAAAPKPPLPGSSNSQPADPRVEGHPGGRGQGGPAPAASSQRLAQTLTAAGSWTWQNPLPDGNPLFGVSCPVPTTCFAAGSNGQILASVNSGSTWTQQSSGIATTINGISCASPTFCVAAGDFGLLVRTTDGAHWTSQTSNNGNFFAAVNCPTTSICYAVGFAGSIYKTIDGGATWNAVVSTKTTSNLFGISCSSAILCDAVGQVGAITSTSDGATWSTPTAGSPTTQTLEAVSCSGGHCAAVGLGGTTIEVFQANPAQWYTKVSGTSVDLAGVSCADAWSCYADGLLGTGLFLLWRPGESTGNWELDSPGPRSDFFAASCTSTATCVIAGSGGVIATTTTRGSAWSAQSGADVFAGWSGVSCPGSLSLCYAAGSGGVVGKSTDQGTTWTQARTVAHGNLTGISCPSASTCVAVSENGEVIATADSGTTWSLQLAQPGTQLYAVSCPAVMACFAVGYPGLVIATTNGGTTWTAQATWMANPPFGPYLSGISCASTTACEAVLNAGSQGGMLGTTDGGTTWVNQGSVPDHLWSVSCPSSLICYAAGNASKMLKTANGGTSWSSLTFASAGYALGVSCSSTTVCAAVGIYPGMGLSTTDGTSWTVTANGGAVALACPTADCVTTGGVNFISGVWTRVSAGLLAVSCPTTLACMAVGGGGLVVTTGDGGSTWPARPSGTVVPLRGVSCPTVMACYAVGDSGVLMATIDGGGSWTTRTAPGAGTMTAVSCGSATACVAVGGGGVVAFTVNGGSSWAGPSANLTGNLNGVSCPSAGACFAVGDSGIYRSADGGATWSGPIATAYALEAISCTSVSTCIAAGGNGLILGTGDGGITWTNRSAGNLEVFLAISCPTASVCVAGATGGLVERSVDGGMSWTNQFAPVFWGLSCATAINCHGVGGIRGVWATSTGGVGGWTTQRPSGNTTSLQGISCPSISTCYAVGYPGTFLVSHDGSTWVDHSINSDVELFAISCPTVTTCFAAGWPGVTYVTTDSGSTWSPSLNPLFGMPVFLFGISCASPTACVAVGTGGSIISTSNGTTWTVDAPGSSQILIGVSCPTSDSCVAVGTQGLTMTKSGGTWHAGNSGTTKTLLGVTCPSVSRCYAVGSAGTVLFSSNLGAGWTAQASGKVQELDAVSCAQPTVCVATGISGTAIVTKDGSNWVDRSFPTFNPLSSVAFPDTAHLWAAGYGGTILFNPTVINLCANASVSVSPPSPQTAGTMIAFSASSNGCSAPLYQFWILPPGGSWTIVQSYSSRSNFLWGTAGAAAGTYHYSVWVRDSSSTSSFDAYVPGAAYTLTGTACTSVTASESPPSFTPAGNTVTITGSASGCGNPNPLYQFWTLAPGGTWTIAQPYSTSAVFNWNTAGLPPGDYHYSVWVRDAGSASSYDAYTGSRYTLTGSPCVLMNTSATPASPSNAGTVVAITALTSGCPNLRYQFWILAPGGSWTIAQPYSSSATFNWDTTGLAAGTYHYSVWVRDASSTNSYDAYFPGTAYTLTSTAAVCASVTATAAPPSPQAAGTPVTITASSGGCFNPRYQFWILAPGGSWTIAHAYSSSPTFNWTTTGLPAGTYRYSVWVRDASSANSYDAYFPGTVYTLT
jgi:photosystem II stability/assembly factor-like uncharacterized protein